MHICTLTLVSAPVACLATRIGGISITNQGPKCDKDTTLFDISEHLEDVGPLWPDPGLKAVKQAERCLLPTGTVFFFPDVDAKYL